MAAASTACTPAADGLYDCAGKAGALAATADSSASRSA